MTTNIYPDAQQSSTYNPLEATRTAPEFLVKFLEQSIGAKLTSEKKTVVLSILAELPEGATMRDLYEAIKAQEAASIGVTPEQYMALSPLLMALQGMQAQGLYAGIFEQPADV
jgi:hypothetical protein